MLDKNSELLAEQDKLEKGGFTGQTIIHWLKGIALLVDFPKKPVRKELHKGTHENSEKGGVSNG